MARWPHRRVILWTPVHGPGCRTAGAAWVSQAVGAAAVQWDRGGRRSCQERFDDECLVVTSPNDRSLHSGVATTLTRPNLVPPGNVDRRGPLGTTLAPFGN